MSQANHPLKVFLSYRRDDLIVAGMIHRLFSRLEQALGKGNVFMDVDRIPPGVDFRKVLYDEVSRADVVVALIGSQWQELLIERKDDPSDFVRIEIESALERGIPTVPLLIGDAEVPQMDAMPESMKEFAYRNAVRVDPGRNFDQDVATLIANLNTHFQQGTEAAESAADTGAEVRSGKKLLSAGLGLAALVAVGIGIYSFVNSPKPKSPEEPTENLVRSVVKPDVPEAKAEPETKPDPEPVPEPPPRAEVKEKVAGTKVV